MDFTYENDNETLEVCEEPYYTQKVFTRPLVFILGLIFIFLLCLLERRKGCNCCKCCCCCFCCRKYFGMIVAVNFLENKEDRAMVLAGFILMTNIITEAVTGETVPSSSPLERMLLKILYVFVICISSFPLLSTIGMESLWSQVMGIIYTVFFASMDVLEEIKFCTDTQEDGSSFITLIFYIPAVLYLFISYVRRILNIKRGQTFDTSYLWKRYQVNYVRRLLTPPPKDVYLGVKKEKLTKKISKAMYAKLSGFRYSLLILISVIVGFITLSLATIQMSIYLFKIYGILRPSLIVNKDDLDIEIPNFVLSIANRLLNKNVVSKSSLEKGISVIDFLIGQLDILVWSLFLSSLIAFLLACFTFILMLVSYKRIVLNMRKKKFINENINLETMNPVNLVVQATQFGGYQVAHIIWGYSLQCLVLFVIFLIIGEIIILPLVYANWNFLWIIVQYATPYLLVIALTYVVQRILVKKCFLQENGKILALNNRKGFYNMMYFMFFYNILAGLIGCLMRMIKSIVFGLFFFPRLDTSIFPRSFESLDSGFVAYLCLVKLEDVQGNNILRIFVYLLLHRRVPMIDRGSKPTSLKEQLLAHALRGRVFKKKARNRWFLIWTLLHNPELSKLRKGAYKKIYYYNTNTRNKGNHLSLISNTAADLKNKRL